MEMRTVYLLRHGQIRLDDHRRYIGQLDLPLTAEGIKQAQRWRKRLEKIAFGAVFCSDLARSRLTAEIIAGDRGVAIAARSDLREISLGEWEGLAFADIARRFPEQFRSRGADIGDYRVPGGESFADCARRVVSAFHAIVAASAGNILIAGHAGVNRLLLCHALGMPLANLFRLDQDYACLNIIQCDNAGYKVKMVNGTCLFR